MVSEVLLVALAARGFVDPTMVTLTDLAVGLGAADAETLDERSGLADVAELSAAECTGYARAAGVLTVDGTADGASARIGVADPAFSNTGAGAWPEARCVFVVGEIDGVEQLLAVIAVTPFKLAASSGYSLPDDRVSIHFAEGSDSGVDEHITCAVVSHLDEETGAGYRPFDRTDIQDDDDLCDAFELACEKVEGLCYAVCGSIPIYPCEEYPDGAQYWEHPYVRCMFPEQAFVHYEGVPPQPAPGEFHGWYWQTAAAGTIGTGERADSQAAGDTGYYDYSRSDDPVAQHLRTLHDLEFFPRGCVSRTASAGEYDDPSSAATVEIAWAVPEGVRSRVASADVVYDAGAGQQTEAMSTSDGGATYQATLPAQANETQVLWCIRVALTGPAETIYEPHAAAGEHTEPAWSSIPADVEGEPAGSGHNLQAKGSCYYYYVLDHAHPYQYGIPELLWRHYTGEKAAGMRRCTGVWATRPWTTIRPGLINAMRFAIDWIANRFHHDPDGRGESPGCCMDWPIMFRWSGGSPPRLYADGGKGRAVGETDAVRPLLNLPDEPDPGSEEARRTWRGGPMMFNYSPSMAGEIDAFEYGDDESWRSWPSWCEYTRITDEEHPWEPGRFIHNGAERGLRAGDRVDRVHLLEIIEAVDYLIESGLWWPEAVTSCKRTPTHCRPTELGYCNYWSYDDSTDPITDESDYDCTDGCYCGACVDPDTEPDHYAEPEDIDECRAVGAHVQECVEDGVCQVTIAGDYYSYTLEAGITHQAGASCDSVDWTPSARAYINCAWSDELWGTQWTCWNAAVTIGKSSYICGPKQTYGGPGYQVDGGGAAIWNHEDPYHGNGLTKIRYGAASEEEADEWEDERCESVQVTCSMGNRADMAMACDSGADHNAVEVGFNSVQAAQWNGPTQPYVTWLGFTDGDCMVDSIAEAFPELPGLGYYEPFDPSSGAPGCLCSMTIDDDEEDHGGLIATCVEASGDPYPYCDGASVWLRVDLNLDSRGVPQLYDYDLTVERISDGATPDQVIELIGEDRLVTEGDVQAPFDTWIG